jgi:hypothetical protein
MKNLSMVNTKKITFILLSLAAFSICVVAQKTPKVDFRKKIAEATPKALPQAPAAKKLKSDAQDKNLKGKVKSIIEYSRSSEDNIRKLFAEEYYNASGNLIKDVSYDNGYPTTVTVWGYIDGNRVSKSGSITLTDEERPPSTRQGFTASPEDNAINPDAPKDERYSMKHVYKYDERGRLVEDWRYQNNGEVWGHTVYNYKGNRREQLNYGQDGSEWSQTIEILDKDGNIIERNLIGSDEADADKEINIHEFDKQGNWIVEKTFQVKTIAGKTVRKLLWTQYRTITYYP